jgi:hypothetical protein
MLLRRFGEFGWCSGRIIAEGTQIPPNFGIKQDADGSKTVYLQSTSPVSTRSRIGFPPAGGPFQHATAGLCSESTDS